MWRLRSKCLSWRPHARPGQNRWPNKAVGPSGHASPASRIAMKISSTSLLVMPWLRNSSHASSGSAMAASRSGSKDSAA